MRFIKPKNLKTAEFYSLVIIYLMLLINIFVFKDSVLSAISAFFGISYTFLAGKGNPKCYLYGVTGSGIYGWLAYSNQFWGHLALYVFYYIPMQILGYFKWKQNLKTDLPDEIIKTKLSAKDWITVLLVALTCSVLAIYILAYLNDKNPIIDGVTTVFSIIGLYLTVRRCIEQWIIWGIVNGLSLIMWIIATLNGAKVYSTVLMWAVYFIFSIYFYFDWKKEVK